MSFDLGDPVRVEMSKWGDQPHWAFDAVWLGSDDQGDWIGIPTGTPMDRPGAHVLTRADQVGLSPTTGLPEGERWWIATFHATDGPVRTYVDMATPPTWDGTVLRCVDLDLDVIRPVDGEVFVDDEDEFAEHRVAYGYPDEVAAAAVRSSESVRAAMTAGHPPYDGCHEPWLARLAELSARS